MKLILCLLLVTLSLPSFGGPYVDVNTNNVTKMEAANALAHCSVQAKTLTKGGAWMGSATAQIRTPNEHQREKIYTFQAYNRIGFKDIALADALQVTVVQTDGAIYTPDQGYLYDYSCSILRNSSNAGVRVKDDFSWVHTQALELAEVTDTLARCGVKSNKLVGPSKYISNALAFTEQEAPNSFKKYYTFKASTEEGFFGPQTVATLTVILTQIEYPEVTNKKAKKSFICSYLEGDFTAKYCATNVLKQQGVSYADKVCFGEFGTGPGAFDGFRLYAKKQTFDYEVQSYARMTVPGDMKQIFNRYYVDSMFSGKSFEIDVDLEHAGGDDYKPVMITGELSDLPLEEKQFIANVDED